MLDKEKVTKESVTDKTAAVKESAVQVITSVIEDEVKIEKITEVIKSDAAVGQENDIKETGYRSEINGVEVDFELQYRDQETDMKDIATRVTEDYTKRGNDASGIKLIQVYLKPTDFTAYYVINNSYEGKIPLF